MKNKIIAVFTACCMICGAFSLNTVNVTDTADNTIKASAAENSKREKRYGKIYYDEWYGDLKTFYASNLDSAYYSNSRYEGDSTSDIDWSKCTDISVSYGYVSAEWSESANDMLIVCGTVNNYSCDDIITFSFEDMEFTLSIERKTMITVTYDMSYWNTTTSTSKPTTTSTSTTTTRPATYTYPITTTATYTYTIPEMSDWYTTTSTSRPVTTTTISTTYRPTTTSTTTYPWWLYTTMYTSNTTTTTTATTTTTTSVQDFRIIPSSVNMKTGDTNKLAIIGVSDISDVMWTSEDTSVVTVSENGTVTAKGTGSTVIYAVYNGNVASCTVKVVSSNNNDNVVYGDSNGDGNINMADATAIVQHIGNKDAYGLSENGLANSDTNGDGQVTGVDAIIIQRIVAKEISVSDLPYNE